MRRFLIIGFCLLYVSAVAHADNYLSPDYKDPKLPPDLLAAYERFAEAAKRGDAETIQSLLLPGAAEISTTPRELKTREYGVDINLPFLRDGFSPMILAACNQTPAQFMLRTGTTAIWFAKVESVGWRIYLHSDKPIE